MITTYIINYSSIIQVLLNKVPTSLAASSIVILSGTERLWRSIVRFIFFASILTYRF